MWNTLRKDIKKKHKQHKLLTYSCLLYVFTHRRATVQMLENQQCDLGTHQN